MGSVQASEFASMVEDGSIDLDAALSWHLGSNHYPPVPSRFIPACKTAIEAANEEDWGRLVDLPEDANYRGREDHKAPASALIDWLHLGSFIGGSRRARYIVGWRIIQREGKPS